MKYKAFFPIAWAFAIFLAAQPARAEMVVIASTAAGVKAGEIIKTGASITVPAGGSVTMVSESGNAVTVTGPFSGIPKTAGGSKGGGDLVKSLAGLVAGGGKSSGSLGTMRAAPGGGPADPADPWMVNVGKPGKQCFSKSGKTVLWRAKPVRPSELKLKNLADKTRVKTPWPAGANTLPWPKGFALSDGATYLARLKGNRKAAKIVIHLVPDDLPTKAHKAVWMAKRGCVGQARLLLGLSR